MTPHCKADGCYLASTGRPHCTKGCALQRDIASENERAPSPAQPSPRKSRAGENRVHAGTGTMVTSKTIPPWRPKPKGPEPWERAVCGQFGTTAKHPKDVTCAVCRRLTSKAPKAPEENRMSVVLAIAGGTASGKTTLAQSVAERLGDRALRVTHDRYYKTLDAALASHPNRVLLHNYDHPDALETSLLVKHLKELRAGRPVRIPDYRFAESARTEESTWAVVHPRPIIIVEGILILADEPLRALFDHIVFVDAPDDIRLARRMKRDIVERGQRPHEVIDQYLAAVRPMHEQFVAPSKAHAHVVLDGTAEIEKMTNHVLGLMASPGIPAVK